MRVLQIVLAICALIAPGAASAADTPALTAGSAKVDITPPETSLGPTDLIHDRLYARAIVVRDQANCAVLVGLDLGAVTTDAAERIRQAASRATGCRGDNIIISATHTHSGTVSGFAPPPGFEDRVLAAIKQAHASAQPAWLGYGTTDVALNVNRDLFRNQKWYQGINREGPSDKTLSVLYFLGQDGVPIGVYMNYAMHPIDFYLSGVVSADFPGAASRHVEQFYGDRTVAVFAQGASGDQNPLLIGPGFALSGLRTGATEMATRDVTAPFAWEVAASETNAAARFASNMSQPVPAERLEAYRQAVQHAGAMVSAMGAILGESAIDVMRNLSPLRTGSGSIWGGSVEVVCPGRDRLDNTAREGVLPPYKDGDPVTIEVGLLRIGDVYISTVDGEVYNEIATRLKREAPVSRIMMTTLANGTANSGYIYSDNASQHLTFQVIGSRLEPGCAEDKVIDASLRLIAQAGTVEGTAGPSA